MTRMPAPFSQPSRAACARNPRTTHAVVADTGPDPRVDEALKLLLAIGVVLVLLLPAARGSVASIGWLPMWLLGMPLVALWASRGFPLRWARRVEPGVTRTSRRRVAPQARRRARRSIASAASQAA